MKTVYVFGNPMVEEDSLPLKILGRLKEKFPSIEFKEFDAVEEIEPKGELTIIDTVKGIRKVEVIEDIDKIAADKIYTMHDFDLGQTLKLWKKMKMVDRVRIFGVPMGISEKESFKQLERLIRSSLP